MMSWQFIGSNILLNTQIGFVIKLMSGTWDNPHVFDITPPPGCLPDESERLLEEGLLEAQVRTLEDIYSSIPILKSALRI